jgi:hypothetical protein
MFFVSVLWFATNLSTMAAARAMRLMHLTNRTIQWHISVSEAQDVLHMAMHPASYQHRLIPMATKITSN